MARLPTDERDLARKRFNNYCRKDPRHAFLRGKFVHDKLQDMTVWRVDAGSNNRALAFYTERSGGDLYEWYWIGSHEQYNGRLG